jgi:RNA polymerase sigma factor (sigma-70 family)
MNAVAPSLSSDYELVAAARAGDDSAYEELYRRYQRRIAAYAYRIVGDFARAEDVTQEAFLSALRRLRETDSEIAFKPWIYEIARNASIDVHRRASRAEEVSINADEGLRAADRQRLVGSSAPDTAVLHKERLSHLQGAFDELADSQHRILVLREFEGLSYREIAERMGLSRPAVESTLFRARRKLEHEYSELDTGRRCAAMSASPRRATTAGSPTTFVAAVRAAGRRRSSASARSCSGRCGRRLPRCCRCRRSSGAGPAANRSQATPVR